uniref:Caspase family p20 domain-containing protein n=1 Tax=Pundamilia nyererei TaxID=303518 RepID=A0A3B4H0D9_9CICH
MMMEEEEDRVESARSSCPSVASDQSKGQPPDFSDESGPTRSENYFPLNYIFFQIYPVTEYSISNRIALLINIRHFYDLKSNRHGAEYDAQAVLNLLYNLGYAVVYYQDLTAQEIDEALIRFSKHRKLFNTDSVFVVLMSHGDLGTIRGSDLKNFEIDKIYERLNTKNCPALMNKPKVIIIQACRGENEGVVTVDASRQSMGTENTGPPPKNIAKVGKVHIEKDFIGFHSSTPHTYSYRNPEYGSNFFHYICDVILTGCCQDDIEELFKKVMQQFEDFPSEQKQMPTKERDTLTKHFYLFPGKYHCQVCASTGPQIQTYSVKKASQKPVFTC